MSLTLDDLNNTKSKLIDSAKEKIVMYHGAVQGIQDYAAALAMELKKKEAENGEDSEDNSVVELEKTPARGAKKKASSKSNVK